MLRKILRSKIHRATVTHVDLHYEGSITIDAVLMETAGLLPNEAVGIWNINNGERFETYVLPGEAGAGEIGLNGAAARKVLVGDLVILTTFGWMEEEQAHLWTPTIVLVDGQNRPLA